MEFMLQPDSGDYHFLEVVIRKVVFFGNVGHFPDKHLEKHTRIFWAVWNVNIIVTFSLFTLVVIYQNILESLLSGK